MYCFKKETVFCMSALFEPKGHDLIGLPPLKFSIRFHYQQSVAKGTQLLPTRPNPCKIHYGYQGKPYCGNGHS